MDLSSDSAGIKCFVTRKQDYVCVSANPNCSIATGMLPSPNMTASVMFQNQFCHHEISIVINLNDNNFLIWPNRPTLQQILDISVRDMKIECEKYFCQTSAPLYVSLADQKNPWKKLILSNMQLVRLLSDCLFLCALFFRKSLQNIPY